MSDGPGGATRSRPAVAAATTVAVAAVTVLVLLVAVWASAVGPDDPLRGDGIRPDRVSGATPSDTETAAAGGTAGPSERDEDEPSSVLPTVVGLLVLGIGAALGLAALWLLGVLLWRLRRVRLRRATREPDAPTLDPAQAVASAMAADAEAHEDLLATGTPRNAVVVCWHRFEVQAERAGLPRRASETSAEFTRRLLTLVEADPAAVERLAELYREARFSEHELGEDARAAALEVVRTIHRDLRSPAGGERR